MNLSRTRVMITLLLMGAGCRMAQTTTPTDVGSRLYPPTTATPPNGPTGRLRVSQTLSCCYIEGSISHLRILDDRDVMAQRAFTQRGDLLPVIDIRLVPGSYQIDSYQRPCDGNCGFLDPPGDRCSTHVDVRADESRYLTVAVTPGRGCTFTVTSTAPRSTTPDRFALRDPYPTCGDDYGYRENMGFTSPERRCLLKANKAGKPAELTAYEEGATTDASSYLVYRTHPDRSIEVYRQADLGSDKDGSWRWRRCESMTADGGPRVFTLNGCSQETAP